MGIVSPAFDVWHSTSRGNGDRNLKPTSYWSTIHDFELRYCFAFVELIRCWGFVQAVSIYLKRYNAAREHTCAGGFSPDN